MLSVRGIPNILGGCNKSLHGDTIFRGYRIFCDTGTYVPEFTVYCLSMPSSVVSSFLQCQN